MTQSRHIAVLNYYHPWTYGGSERFLSLLHEELAVGMRVIYVYVDDTDSAAEISKTSHETCYAGLELYKLNVDAGTVVPVSPAAASRHRGELSLAAMLEEADPRYLRAHYPADAFVDYLETQNSRPFVYDVIDLWTDFPIKPWGDDEVERAYLRLADGVVATAQSLTALAPVDTPCAVIPNGVSYAFAQECLAIRAAAEQVAAPSVLYMGNMAGVWFDWALLERLCREIPDVPVTLLGGTELPPKERDEEQRDNVGRAKERVSSCPNTTFIPEVPHSELPSYLAAATVGIIPFKPSPLVTAVSPLKVFEYVGAGLDVVSVGMPDIEGYKNVLAARSPDEFVELTKRALSAKVDWRARSTEASDFSQENSWRVRAEAFDSFVSAVTNR